MASQVFYRKWRPQKLSDVVGQEHVTQTLHNALATGRVAHAYLFCGPRGTGKTSTARILAKAVNCLNGSGEPCNSCSMCQAITEGRAFDLIEIDAASNRGIDDIRDLREKTGFAPTEARYKVYIVDEVHMLTEPAFNALLKTLEEPPAHAIFVLATTEVHKLPPTILSRCQRFDFRRLSQTAVVGKLKDICQEEGIDADAEALTLIARSATGSLRDAENLMEQFVISSGGHIRVEQVRVLLGLTGDHRIRELARSIVGRDIASGLTTINGVASDGIDLRQFNRELVEYLRQLLLLKAGAEEAVDVSAEALPEMRELASGASMEDLVRAVRLFGEQDRRFEAQSTLPLELALVECSLSKAETILHPVPPPATQRARPATAPPPRETSERSPPRQAQGEAPREARPPVTEPVAPPDGGSPDLEHFRRHWGRVVEALRGVGSKGNLDAMLRNACEPVAVEGDTIVLGFYYTFHKERVEDRKYLHLIENKVSEVFGAPYRLRCILTPRKPSPLMDAAIRQGARVVEEDGE